MPTELLVTIGITSALTFGILFLRVPAFAVLFSLLVGQVLSLQAGDDVYSFVGHLSGLTKLAYVQVALILLPVILTIVFLRGRTEKNKLFLELLPAVFSSITLLLLLYPHLEIIKKLLDETTHSQIEGYRSTSLIIASVLGLISVWISFPKPHHKGKHEK